MAFEDEFFKRKRVNFNKLLAFGFMLTDKGYTYSRDIMDRNFQAQIEIDRTGRVSGRLLDKDLDEEYTAIYVLGSTGNYVGKVREAYGKLLIEIAESCFEDRPFNFDQTNRLAQHLQKKYGDQFDYPFTKYPQYASYRHPANRKWYALIFNLQLGKLDFDRSQLTQQELEHELEVVNIKIDKEQERLEELLNIDGIYPSYHMNKKSWISIVLDGQLADEFLYELVDRSRDLVGPKGYKVENGSDYWLIPANPKYYDIDAEFAATDIIKWTQKAQIKKGDWVFIYVTAPVKAVRYACRVLDVHIPNNNYRENSSIKELMEIKRIKTFDDASLSMEVLKAHGVKTVRGPRRMTKEMIDLVEPQVKDC
ncbi:MmcQ/YjbR family DNA-binding protein [Streptococcus dentapri]|uniref:MmcQ/YjbR family DNA-binding protein n=1 Tax=Streptococcus dentapri TaxID=573564 RepID=A0ABV8D234_9STRE